jgi:hypothetical protein
MRATAAVVSIRCSVFDLLVQRRRSAVDLLPLVWEGVSARAGAAVALAGFAAVACPAAVSGAYFPTSWGWTTLVFSWTAVLALIARRAIRLSRLELATLLAFGSLVGWVALSALWSETTTQTMLEVERGLVYATALMAVLVVVRRRSVGLLLGAVLCAITAISAYALATRLFPERLGRVDDLAVNRLEQPFGYWNALGVFAAMGALIALGSAARAPSVLRRALSGAALPILLPTLYFTFGRGAWIALGAGLVTMFALDARRLQLATTLLVLAPSSVAAVWLCSRSDALTTRAPLLADATREGHRLAPILAGLALAGGLAGFLAALVEGRLPPLPRGRMAYGVLLWLAALSGAAAIVLSYGSPWSIARRGYGEFARPPVATQLDPARARSLNRRLFSFWGNGRAALWRVAWRDTRAHPWLGSGAGTYERYWLRHRSIPGKVRDAHSLYLETLAELGAPGLALLAVCFGLPLLAYRRARRLPVASGALGAYVAYVVHAGADWDWEVPAVTLTALFCGATLLIAGRPLHGPRRCHLGSARSRPRRRSRRAALRSSVSFRTSPCRRAGVRRQPRTGVKPRGRRTRRSTGRHGLRPAGDCSARRSSSKDIWALPGAASAPRLPRTIKTGASGWTSPSRVRDGRDARRRSSHCD